MCLLPPSVSLWTNQLQESSQAAFPNSMMDGCIGSLLFRVVCLETGTSVLLTTRSRKEERTLSETPLSSPVPCPSCPVHHFLNRNFPSPETAISSCVQVSRGCDSDDRSVGWRKSRVPPPPVLCLSSVLCFDCLSSGRKFSEEFSFPRVLQKLFAMLL